ncbi:MAG: hypothetical protein BXU00_02250 [Candidatus Nanoclepta minutus]|uniref:Dolichyl-phosphooligosaccharide-protein glycotransferase n=1 Tax=Candidatus Nanoclepta minutus TaxID=1940235 RepID=A0A397WMQ5_9ARCH|nr:MAG: hypothetical protein BXU00_02250 [Candidatus Nanoclepta minutus]
MVFRNKDVLKDIVLCLLIFSVSFGSKGLLLNNLGDYNLVGPDPYLFYSYMMDLYTKGYIPDYDPSRYYPIGTYLTDKDLVSYLGLFSLLILKAIPSLSFLSILGIYPLANQITWLAANFTVPLFFGLSSVVFFLLAKELFKDRKLATVSSIIYSINVLIGSRIIAFDTELGAILFIVLSLYFYILGIKNNAEKNKIKRYILIGITVAGIILLYYFIKYFPNSDHLQTFTLLSLFTALLILYPLFKPSKEYFYTLLIFSTILARKGWGGWVIIPLVIGVVEVLRFVLGRNNPEISYYALFIPYFSLLEYEDILISSLFEVHNIIILVIPALYLLDYLFSKFKIYEKTDRVYERLRLFKIVEKNTFYRLFLIFLLIIISIPYISKYINNIISPYSDRMITSVAEFQKFSGLEYLRNYTVAGAILSTIALIYLLWDKKEKWKLLYALSFSALFLSSLFLLDNFLSLTGATILSWSLVFFVIIPWIILSYKDISDEELFVLITSILLLIIGKYIYRLAFFAGFSLSLLFPISLNWLGLLDKYKKDTISEILTHIFFLISSVTAFYLVFYILQRTRLFIFPLIFPAFFYVYFIIQYYFRNKDLNLTSYLKFSLLLTILYGFYNRFGYITYYFFPLYTGGTEDNIIYSALWINFNTENNSAIHFWWDYGYYMRVLGNRTVWLSGDNSYPYWNHLMGRYGLAGTSFNESLELLYVHSSYNYHIFKILELFGKNKVFYDYLYKDLNFSKEEIDKIINLKERLGDGWISLLFKFNGSKESIEEFGLSEKEIQLIKKIYEIDYVMPSYLYIDPTDIGKSYQFTRLGSDLMYDKVSWISNFFSALPEEYNVKLGVRTVIGNKVYYVFANNDTLSYFGDFPLDEDLYINNVKIPRCIPDLGINNCGRIVRVDIKFLEPIVELKQLRESINYSKISPWLVRNLTALLYYNGKYYNLTLGCLYLEGARLDFPNPDYYGCLYVTPSITNPDNISSLATAYFISQKSMNYTWVKLYFFEDSYPYFELVFYTYPGIPPIYKIPLEIYQEAQPSKVWKIYYPENFTVPEYKYCLYLATNLEEINKCSEIYGLKNYKSIWEV